MAKTKSTKKEAIPVTDTQQPISSATIGKTQAAEAASEPVTTGASTTQAEAIKPRAPKAPTPKLEAVRTESRGNVVPINVQEEIRKVAYLLSERRGFEPGHESEDWLTAEREVLQRYRHQSAQSASA